MGIGEAIALTLAENGMNVALMARSKVTKITPPHLMLGMLTVFDKGQTG
jgi:NADP-dependent 3-hydroxy acid dehydrogenase YdfG